MSKKKKSNKHQIIQVMLYNKIILYFYIILWEPKMCRLAWQLLGMLGNVLDRPRHASQRLRHASQRPRHACNVLSILGMLPARSQESHIEDKPPHLQACLGRCKACRGGRGRCQACLGVAKQAYTSQVPTILIEEKNDCYVNKESIQILTIEKKKND